jgi:hypothetical protein
MLFTLEAIEARKGDSLILHFGRTAASPRFIVIDGGPATVYQNSLKPRLNQLRDRFRNEDDDKLDIEMLMVSHIDDDHIRGVLDLVDELAKHSDDGEELPWNIRTLWFNSFDDVLGNGAAELQSRVANLASAAASEDRSAATAFNPDPEQGRHTAAIIASVAQGRKLRSQAQQLAIPFNAGSTGLVMMRPGADNVINIGSGLRFHILCPSRERLEELRRDWDKHVKAHPGAAETAAFADKSVANLSSIVVAAEMTEAGTTKRMLLTGDARGDHILEGLEASSLPKTGNGWHFDLFKLPHHGSNRNATKGFFQAVTADHYVISANGEHDNPDAEIIYWLAEARGDAAYTIHITNKRLFNPKPAPGKDISKLVSGALDRTAAIAPNRKVVQRDDNDLSVRINLGSAAPLV